ncbi:MAG: DUF1206 domain-containing protein [Alphaproteobacteria bacterium]|nr:MAG: DUF1206 domain-containing protein [Alphaproteobacteria bacterium]
MVTQMSNKFQALARTGYAARGVVYILLGSLALTSAFVGGEATDSSSAMSSLLQLPFGRILLALIAAGLGGHILWRLAQGFLDADNVGTDAKAIVRRLGSLVSGAANLFLALTAGRMSIGQSGGAEGGGEEKASAWLLQQPFGGLLLGIVAVLVIVAGAVQILKALTRKYRDRMKFDSSHGWLDSVCSFGLIARGTLIVIMGGFTGHGAITFSPERAGGMSDTLDYVRSLPLGPWLYGLAAIGLVAFGGYSIIQARYRHINVTAVGKS